MQKSFGGQIVIPSQATSAIKIVNPTSSEEVEIKKVVLKPPLKGFYQFYY